jgi:hypothetical protein
MPPVSVDYDRLAVVIDELAGPRDAAGDRAAAVVLAQVNALAWARDTVGAYPVPAPIAAALQVAADELRADDRDPVEVLIKVALDEVSTYRAAAAA